MRRASNEPMNLTVGCASRRLSCKALDRRMPGAARAFELKPFTVELEREEDGRWIGEVPDLPGVLTYGRTRDEAVAKAKALAFRVLADRLEHGEDIPEIRGVSR
jgi:predicted RNase H-like HicB family nuclease